MELNGIIMPCCEILGEIHDKWRENIKNKLEFDKSVGEKNKKQK